MKSKRLYRLLNDRHCFSMFVCAVVNHDIELLGLPSDQLIHSDVELEAVESIVPPPRRSSEDVNVYYAAPDQLPFGARLPGFEKIDYAYGYEIRGSQDPQVIETTTLETTTAKPSAVGTFHAIFFSDSLKQHLTPPDKEYLPPSPDPQSPKADQPPVETLLEISDGYLPPDLELKTDPPPPPALSDQYLPPDPATKPKASSTPPPPLPSDEYLPPNLPTRTEPPPPFLSEYLPPPPDLLEPVDRVSLNPILPNLPKPAVGAVWKVEEQKSPLEGKEPTLQPLSIQTAHKDAPIEFVGKYTTSPPLGIVGVPEERITAVTKETIKPPLGVVAAVEDPPLHFQSETPPEPPVGAIGEPIDKIIIADSEKTVQPPLSIVGDLKTNKIHFESETTTLAPFAIISELQPEPIRFQSEVFQPQPYALVSEPQENIIRAHAEQPKLGPYAVIGEPIDNAIKAEAHSRPVVVGAIAEDNPACEKNIHCAEDQICKDGLCINACVIAAGLCVGHAKCVARRHIPGCVCPDMFTAVTRRRSGHDQYDCMPMMMMAAGTTRGVLLSAGRASSMGRFTAPIAGHRRTSTRISHPPLAVLSKMLMLRPPPGTLSAC